MIVLDLEGLIYRFLDSLPHYFMIEGADEECIGLDSGRGCIKLRNFNKDISNLYQYIRMVLKFLFIFLGGMKNALVDIRYHGWHGTASDLVAADVLDLCAVSMEMFDCKT